MEIKIKRIKLGKQLIQNTVPYGLLLYVTTMVWILELKFE